LEIEAALQSHPAIEESAAVASPDPFRGGKIMRRVSKFQEFNEVQRANKLISVSSVSGINEQ